MTTKKRRTRKESHWHAGQPSGYDWIHRTTRIAIYLRDHEECLACGNTADLTLDHLRRDIPKADQNKPTNLVTLCLTCNSSRRSTASEVWDPKFHELAYFQVKLPLDRKRAREIAKERWPQRFAQQYAATKKWRERKAKEAADAAKASAA